MKCSAPARHETLRRAFSLIELMIVILIIGLVVALVLPALGRTKISAKNAATTSLVNNISQACSQFILSERRMPGYFSSREMGSGTTGNEARGFTAMENVMIDLAGGRVAANTPGAIQVGPVATNLVWIDPKRIGVPDADNKGYFTPPAKNFKLQDGSDGGTKFGAPEHNAIPDIVDSDGMPILMWVADQMAIQPVATVTDFVSGASGGAKPARYYWNSNIAFLNNGNRVGSRGIDQSATSLLGSAQANHLTSLMGFLGNPASPDDRTKAISQILPTTGRGQFTIQAAGSKDGQYFGKNERGGAMAAGVADTMYYGFNFKTAPLPGTDLIDKDGHPTSIDFAGTSFDDIIISGG